MLTAEEFYETNSVVDNICRLNPDLLVEPCQHILSYLRGHSKGVDSGEIYDMFQRAGVTLDHESLENVVRFLLLTFRSAGKSKVSADELVSRLEKGSNKWSKESLQVLHSLWNENGESVQVHQATRDLLSVGRIVDMQWKLSMAVSSDTCRSLNSPFVTILLKIAEPSGKINQKALEMTVPQFQNFHKQMKEMAAVMETV
ncbi:COMM domain-containing protein 6 [Corythoichthys intestinalis]|uniref:COMM domain-containing protein 6 n=1 Tax=Corythoichthys intestinalis TaxID=161448 RepID=UPI0025A5397F|nr:COMM domain-containing protein 6 [Corythoichthys intestinalis]XP_061799839.1 COMM domain-containing protein 6-like [Nerophis lumbriciformis]